MYIIINNKILKAEKALIPVADRGFRFGDGVFETCLIDNGSIYNFTAHLSRLKAGLKAIKINIKNSDKNSINDKFYFDNLTNSCYQLIKKNQIKNGFLRIAISRGVGSEGYLPAKNNKPTLIIETINSKTNFKPKNKIKLLVSSIEKPSIKSLPVSFKLMQGLNSTLVKMEANQNNCFDGIILNEKKQICETASANIFWVKNNILYTPHKNCGCLIGTIRQKIIDLSPIKLKLVKVKLINILEAEEVFLTNVKIGVLAVDQIGDTQFKNRKYSKIFTHLLKKDIKNYVMQNKS